MSVTEDTTTAALPQIGTRQEAKLPLLARVYVAGVIAAGALVLVYCATHVHVTQWALFISLIVLSCLASALKVRLPLTRSASTMSVSYVVDSPRCSSSGRSRRCLSPPRARWRSRR